MGKFENLIRSGHEEVRRKDGSARLLIEPA